MNNPLFKIPNATLRTGLQKRYSFDTYVSFSSNDRSLEPIENNDLAHGTYGGLLFDQRWKNKRVIILERDGHKCVVCKQSSSLQVHHRQYHFITSSKQFKAPWDYEDHLLITLCENCHKKGHRTFKVPTINL